MAITGQTSGNELVRGKKKKSYEEVMQRKMLTELITGVYPSFAPIEKFVSSSDLVKSLKKEIDEQFKIVIEASPYAWFNITYSWECDYYNDTSIAIYGSRYETDQEYNKRTTAWLKRQKNHERI